MFLSTLQNSNHESKNTFAKSIDALGIYPSCAKAKRLILLAF
jgi:hypothetical protein